MAEEQSVLRGLNALGVDEVTVEVLALLPLIQVAWADGEIQPEERETILRIAREQYHLGEDGAHLLEGWLSHPPSPSYLERCRRVLVALAHEHKGFSIQPDHLDDVVDFSRQVAEAAGGFLGFRTIDESEAQALADIAAALSVSHQQAVTTDLFEFDEDDEDDATDVRSPAEMRQILSGLIDDSAGEYRGGGGVGQLVQHGGEGAPVYPINADGLSIGRSRANVVQVAHDGQVSRFHCKFVVSGSRVHLEDNGTTNGTWVNGERIVRRRLYGGEQIAVGGARFTFRVG